MVPNFVSKTHQHIRGQLKLKVCCYQKNTEKRSSGIQSTQAALQEKVSHRIIIVTQDYDYYHHDYYHDLFVNSPDHIDCEEGKPTEDETTNNYSDRLGSLCLHAELSHLIKSISFYYF